jgi:hypothetical protein
MAAAGSSTASPVAPFTRYGSGIVPPTKNDRGDDFVLERAVSESPFARQHEQVLATGGTRKIADTPWGNFDRSAYPEEALRLAELANRALAMGEYGAIAVFSRISSSMALHGAPIDLVCAATRIPTDELRHAEYARAFASACAGKPVTIKIPRAAFDTSALSLEELDRSVLELSAIGEALACALLDECLEQAEDPVAKIYFGNLVRDEVHHTRLGWHYLAWRSDQWTDEERQAMADFAGRIVMDVEPRFSRGRSPKDPAARAAARALGVLDSAAQVRAVREVTGEQIVPALDELGLGASFAWKARTRVRA